MSQYKTGLANFTNGSNVVDFSTETDLIAAGVAVGDLLVAPDEVVYRIASINTPQQLTIVENYAGTTVQNAGFVIHLNFTPNFHFPLFDSNDADSSNLLSDTFTRLDAALQSLTDDISAVGDTTQMAQRYRILSNGNPYITDSNNDTRAIFGNSNIVLRVNDGTSDFDRLVIGESTTTLRQRMNVPGTGTINSRVAYHITGTSHIWRTNTQNSGWNAMTHSGTAFEIDVFNTDRNARKGGWYFGATNTGTRSYIAPRNGNGWHWQRELSHLLNPPAGQHPWMIEGMSPVNLSFRPGISQQLPGYDSCIAYKDSNGIVHVEFAIQLLQPVAHNDYVATIPTPQLRPAGGQTKIRLAMAASPSSLQSGCRIHITSNGRIYQLSNQTISGWLAGSFSFYRGW